MPWPIGTLPIVEPDQYVGSSPCASPGASTPVRLPKPKRPIQPSTRSRPSICASVIVPTFEDCERICATVIRWVGRGSCSWMIRSATRIDDGSVNAVDGLTIPSESAAATVTTLNVEPGSYVSVTTRLRRLAADVVPNRFASYPGATAIASTAPVRGSSTTALPPFAFQSLTVSRSTVSALAWIRWSIVMKTSSPARSGFVAITSITRPAGSRTVVWLPGLPTSALSSERSSPSSPSLSIPA